MTTLGIVGRPVFSIPALDADDAAQATTALRLGTETPRGGKLLPRLPGEAAAVVTATIAAARKAVEQFGVRIASYAIVRPKDYTAVSSQYFY